MQNNSKLKIKLSIVAISLSQGLANAISPVVGQMQEAFPDVNISTIQFLVSAPSFMAMLVALAAGWLIVKISKKRLVITGLFLLAFFGTAPFYLTDFKLILTSRILLGIGTGMIIPLNTGIVAEHFEGRERVATLGIQSASVGAGMLIASALSGTLGMLGYRYSFIVYLMGVISALAVMMLLPETGLAVQTRTEKIRLSPKVFIISAFAFCEMLFLISYSTNISMHIGGAYAGNSSISGTVVSVFSAAQIIIGFLLGTIAVKLKGFTLPCAMLSGGIGFAVLLFFPRQLPMLFLGSLLVGFSQGAFVPQGMFEVSNAVAPVAASFATAVLNIFQSIGMLLSPYVLNGVSLAVFGKIETTNVFTIASCAMILLPLTVSAVLLARKKHHATAQ